MVKFIDNKKGEIGVTLTWMVATGIIVFLVLIYLIFIAGIKIIEKEDITVSKQINEKSLVLMTQTINFFNSEIFIDNNKISVKKALKDLSLIEDKNKIKEYKRELKNQIKKWFEGLGEIYYLLDVKYNLDEDDNWGENLDLRVRSFEVADIYDTGAPDYNLPYYVFDGVNMFYLFSNNNEKIEIRLYVQKK